MKKRSLNRRRIAQAVVVLVCVFALKHYYSTATADQLRWILAPTAVCVEVVSGTSFEFESGAGYMSSDQSFLIASSCAGVNFLIAAFLLLSMRRLLGDPSKSIKWGFIPAAAGIAYLVTIIANTARIAIALRSHEFDGGWLNPSQLHRIEGIFIYFGFLLLLFVTSESMTSNDNSGLFKKCLFPLVVYYATTFGMPIANGAYRQGAAFWEHSLIVLLIPLVMILPVALFHFCRSRFLRSETIRPRAWLRTQSS
ncbi:MAG TPA: exosortase K [Blastocatellia bacterium]|nr:exosortase K [Blastocatellia bacterium]